ncbi:DUF6265 family protein [Brevundimonas sp. 2R-24]|uniref:DUF6265 family protein n=1 Tax=Peiella sedimenti TaxID=3061083 RepID=A0ABT8SJC6_9CAUL|nr:DUF6265 family protein [Caulobacteraceae bacterium XZ-24]
MLLTVMAMTAMVQAAEAPAAPDLGWLAGYWLNCAEDGRETSETWSDPRGGILIGFGLTVVNGQAGWEQVQIGPNAAGQLTFFAQPSGQRPAQFPMAEVGEQSITFENPAHDFPQQVSYRREGDVLIGAISGVLPNGQTRGIEWRYERAELNARCPAPEAQAPEASEETPDE